MPAILEPGLAPTPDFEVVAGRYVELEARIRAASSAATIEGVHEWNRLRAELATWANLTRLRFSQNTADADARKAREQLDEHVPAVARRDTALRRLLIANDHRAEIARAFGEHLLHLWTCDIATFDPAVEPDLIAEAKLCAEYTRRAAAIEVHFNGERMNLAQIRGFQTDPDRSVRHDAAAAQWAALAEAGDELDDLFDRLVHVRDRIARKLGYANYLGLGYARMRRTDYDLEAVRRFRNGIVLHVVPLAHDICVRAARRLNVRDFARWDEAMLGLAPSPRPRGDADDIVHETVAAFDELDPSLGDFARLMDESELMDLAARSGKAGGGYCTAFPTLGVPFVFANFNGSSADVDVLVHELGHAFQAYESRALPLDFLAPTMEAAEVHSTTLEFFNYPQTGRYFGDRANDYRENHFAGNVLFLAYASAIDHFQQLVYESPNATRAERHGMWQTVERRYLPWRRYGDLARPAVGAFWQSQLHVFTLPLYFIDYALAVTCAMQFAQHFAADGKDALARYIALCARGGSAPFQTLVTDAGLASPFDDRALPAIGAFARQMLDL